MGKREGQQMADYGLTGTEPGFWERVASTVAAIGTCAFFFSAVGYGWYSLLVAMAR